MSSPEAKADTTLADRTTAKTAVMAVASLNALFMQFTLFPKILPTGSEERIRPLCGITVEAIKNFVEFESAVPVAVC